MSPIPDYPPQQAGKFWVLPTIDEAVDEHVDLHVSIAVSEEDDLQGSDLQVEVTADNQNLIMVSGPGPGRLATSRLVSVNAHGFYTFENPGDLPPSTVTVTVRAHTTTFEVSGSV